MTKVAVGADSIEALRSALGGRARDGETYITTRYKPTRAETLVGGSLFWIIRHRLIARAEILGFAEGKNGEGRPCCVIRLANDIVAVRAQPRRAHQGWRYLEDKDAPPDLAGGDADIAALPPELASELSGMGLI
ncbi:DUF1489 domain-containing protein [Sphingomonas sp. XMGL2]|uniref:DUF1489 domain-containing protein n=1 Tax=Sphingomonas quercus TaxID=2842451 RepID=A0ABS6BK11_9SPHN|nr:DUF1489 domain-containing protein [Sphingomonas quercus]MBU3078161.1 DUF1489 domain-containing protein [Sphingomonas quercus]